jgi:rSAM/selenodomain-associated transferase 1
MATLVVFARFPKAGKVKTRLAADLGIEGAAELYEAFLLDTLDRTAGITKHRLIAYTPADEAAAVYFEGLRRPDDGLCPQPEGDLGRRLEFAAARAFELGGPVILMGTDSPTLPIALLSDATRRLEEFEVVLSPAADGGYVLLGLRAMCPEVFEGIPWSTSGVAAATMEAARRASRKACLLREWYDVDTLADLQRLRKELRRGDCRDESLLRTRSTVERLGRAIG